MEETVLIVKFGEVAMRGNNRHIFISQLVKTMRNNLDKEGDFYIVKEQGRLIVEDRGADFNTGLKQVKDLKATASATCF